MQRNANKSEKGITLIALVVTIVVLLILAGVSLSLVLGENGIINKAKEAGDKYGEAYENEQSELNKVDEWLEENIGGSTGGEDGTDGEGTQDLPSTGETKPYLPGNNFYYVGGTLDLGIVISDNESDKNKYKDAPQVGTELAGNQYVWIEVPKKAEVYPTAGLNITNFTEEEYTKIENDLHTYTDYYRRDKNGTITSFTDTYYADKGNAGWFASETEYNILKQKMLKSVYQNGGFWIGRYEAGIEERRSSSGEVTVTPVSKADQYPYTYVTRTQAHVLAQKVNSGNYTSSLMFGVQWDLVMKFLETKGVSQSDLRSDSTEWGNYYNSTFKLDRGKYAKYNTLTRWYDYNQDLASCVESSVKQSSTNSYYSILLTTGASDATKKMNIYDLAGNVYEWTLEYTSSDVGTCARRGGYYFNYGPYYPASNRETSGTANSDFYGGFRLSLF